MINRFISESLSGYFIVPVKVEDTAGEDTANVTVGLHRSIPNAINSFDQPIDKSPLSFLQKCAVIA